MELGCTWNMMYPSYIPNDSSHFMYFFTFSSKWAVTSPILKTYSILWHFIAHVLCNLLSSIPSIAGEEKWPRQKSSSPKPFQKERWWRELWEIIPYFLVFRPEIQFLLPGLHCGKRHNLFRQIKQKIFCKTNMKILCCFCCMTSKAKWSSLVPLIPLDIWVISTWLQITSVLALLATMAGVALYMDPEVRNSLTIGNKRWSCSDFFFFYQTKQSFTWGLMMYALKSNRIC